MVERKGRRKIPPAASEPAPAYDLGLSTGDVLRLERERRGFTMRAAARSVGVSPSHMSEVERSKKQASESVLVLLSTLYGLDVWELCVRDGRLPGAFVVWLKTHATTAPKALRELMRGARG